MKANERNVRMNIYIRKISLSVFLMITLVACSSAKSELTEIHEDVTTHVKEPIVEIRDEMKMYEEVVLEDLDVSPEEFEEHRTSYLTYLENDMIQVLKESREYLYSYDTPRTEEGKNILSAYTNTYEAYFDLLEENGQFLIELLNDNVSDHEFDDFDKKLAAIDAQINEEIDELNELFVEYSDQYSISFIHPLH